MNRIAISGDKCKRHAMYRSVSSAKIKEQSLEWNNFLLIYYVNFEKPFDRLDSETLSNIMDHYGIPHQFINFETSPVPPMKTCNTELYMKLISANDLVSKLE